MKKEPLIVIVILAFALIIGGTIVFMQRSVPESEQPQASLSNILSKSEQGLGSLCSDEQSCVQFCLANRGRCESYCKGTASELCKTLFSPNENTAQSASPKKKETCVSNPSPLFTHTFADINKIAGISQFGNNAFNNPGSQARSYVFLTGNEMTTIYAPLNATITHIYYSDKNYSGYVRPEYRIDLDVSCEVHIAFDHVVNIADWLKPFAPQTPSPGRNPGIEVNIPVKAGDTIGSTTGTYRTSTSGGFDFLFLNKAKHLPRLNEARWTTDHSLYYGCPYDYFTPELQQQYYTLLQKENAESSCGPRVKEVMGTPQGYWFQGNATELNGPRFVIYEGKHFVEWTLIRNSSEKPVSYRDTYGGRASPTTIAEGKNACYFDQDKNTHLYLKMFPQDKLSLVSGTGACPSSFPEEKAEVWER